MKVSRQVIAVGFALGIIAVSASAQSNKSIEDELLRSLANIQKLKGGSGSFDDLEKENKIFQDKILKYGKRLSVLKYGFPTLSKQMFIATSRDGKFRIYSWDNQTGGTMRDHENVFQFQARDGGVKTMVEPRVREGESRGFYTQIFQTDTPDGRVYLANSTFIASTSLMRQDLSAFRIDGAKINTNVKIIRTRTGLTDSVGFNYDFFSVVDRPERPVKLFYYDEARKAFRFPVVIQDRKTPQGRVTSKFITYRFNGKEFVRLA